MMKHTATTRLWFAILLALATLAIIRRELNSWTAAAGEAAGLFLLAYLVTLLVYQIGSWLELGTKMLG